MTLSVFNHIFSPFRNCVASPFMVRQACPEQPFILREPQDERLVEGLTTNGPQHIKNQLPSRSP